ncbi:unnamed protein product [Citrullus colocynthis]|uniref:Uncharacterized protein n=1 Tax=Citrullus colocynthis TaxID=252529 RepID=A0ABP0ZB47_9ROSI
MQPTSIKDLKESRIIHPKPPQPNVSHHEASTLFFQPTKGRAPLKVTHRALCTGTALTDTCMSHLIQGIVDLAT